MSLTPGTRLGPYEILSPLGAGGMGEVYRARDTRLGRDVAVKVLPQHLSANPEVRTRFEREAKTVSSLNHPNICTLHDVGRDGDIDYLVMELVEGETLADRLTKGLLSLADVLRIGSQIADALDRAHRAGVVHRDLKPGNIMLTKSGAKLMDFGLARATGMAGPASGSGVTMAALTQSPTIAQPLTAEGTIVGTFQYMAPEQLEGQETDARSDIWSLGCVLYEMTTGRRAFEGKSQASLIGAIMNAAPTPVSQIAPMAPPELDRLVRACLVRDPADRLQSAHDVKIQLAWVADGSVALSGASMAAVPSEAAKPRKQWPAFVLVGLAGAALASAVLMLVPRGSHAPATTRVPARYVLGSARLSVLSGPAIAPDGSYVLFSRTEDRVLQIYQRHFSSFDMTPVAGTEGGRFCFISPDGAWIGFCTDSEIKKVPATGGVAQVIANEPTVDAATWTRDDMIYFCQRFGGGAGRALARVPAAGGATVVVAPLDTVANEGETWEPHVMPDGKTVLITVEGGSSSWHVDAVRPDGSRVKVIDGALGAQFNAGRLFYIDNASNAVLSAPFDVSSLKFTGPAIPLTEPVDPTYSFAIDDDRVVYVPAAGAGEGREVVWLSREGAPTQVTNVRAPWTQPRVSPDGTRILLRKVETNCELWVYDIQRASLARIITGGDNHDPVWSPDGKRIAYLQASAGGHMVVQTVEGTRDVTVIPTGSERGHPECWSAGGNRLVFTSVGRGTRLDIWTCAMDGPLKPEPFLASEFNERTPSISPDGKFIAYVTNETGSDEVFVQPFPRNGDVWQISVGGGDNPLWSRDGRELFFTSGSKMMVMGVQTHPAFHIGPGHALFDGGFNLDRDHDFDVAPDGRLVAVRVPGGVAGQRDLRMLLNWKEELVRLEGTPH
jgi:Tol biopolymer transport system component